jgi:hypothetical protein
MKKTQLIIYASYPKTGSTYIPDILENINKSGLRDGVTIDKVKFLQSKNNFLIRNYDDCSIMIKTHWSPVTLLQRIKQARISGLQSMAEDLNDEVIENCKIIYITRNPFRVLVSAINYSKLIYGKSEVRERWAEQSIDGEYFIDFLNFKSIPTVEEFNDFDISRVKNEVVEKILSRYVAGKGCIPIFGKIGYFSHIGLWVDFMKQRKETALFTYEGLMLNNDSMLRSLAHITEIPDNLIIESIKNLEMRRNNPGDSLYSKPFYSEFGMETPKFFSSLASFPILSEQVDRFLPDFKTPY